MHRREHFGVIKGALVMVLLIVVHFVAARHWPSLRSVTSLLLLGVAYASFRGGIRGGAISGVLAFLYLTYDFSGPRFFQYDRIDTERMVSLIIVIPGIIGLMQSLRLRAIESRLAAIRSLEEVSSRIAHDLRGTLIPIQRYADILKTAEGKPLSPEAHAYVERIRHNAAELDRLTNELLEVTEKSRSL